MGNSQRNNEEDRLRNAQLCATESQEQYIARIPSVRSRVAQSRRTV